MKKVLEIEFEVRDNLLTDHYIEEHIKKVINFGDNLGEVRSTKVVPITRKTEEYYKELALVAAYITSNDLLNGTIFHTFNEAYKVAKEFVEEYPVDTKWIEKEYDETIEEFVKERYINGRRREYHSIGDRFRMEFSGDEFILASVGNNLVQLIYLKSGHRLNDSILVKNSLKITEEELSRLEDIETFVKLD